MQWVQMTHTKINSNTNSKCIYLSSSSYFICAIVFLPNFLPTGNEKRNKKQYTFNSQPAITSAHTRWPTRTV